MHVDSEVDYDGYCNYIKESGKIKAMASFFILLSTRGENKLV